MVLKEIPQGEKQNDTLSSPEIQERNTQQIEKLKKTGQVDHSLLFWAEDTDLNLTKAI